ncbi:MAG: glutathione ABC transporter substrate-binding protein [Negativicutes bacterium]|nr:glutathione ABC transporter substrate-binding protein [Negativicutes bacterium]
MGKKSLWGIGLFLILSLAITGCGSKESTTDKTFVYALQADARTLDPHMSTDASSSNSMNKKVYETLITTDKDNKIVPLLATEWKQIDPVTWEFTLRKGVKFHDGSDFNAQAVKASFERLLDPATKRNRRSVLQAIKEVKVIGDDKVQIITDGPYAPLLLHLTHSAGSIMSPKAIEADAKGDKPLPQNPVGTGPFKFVSWTKGDNITLARNDGYWGTKPQMAKVILKIVPEDATRIAMVKTGEAQAADQVPVTDVERIGKDSSMNLVRTTIYRSEFISFNTERAPFNNPKVREAISQAIDYDGLIKGVYNGVGTTSVSSMGPQVFGHNPNLKPYVYNMENAKKLLADAGYPNGFKATLYVPDRKIRIKMAEVIQAQLKPLGIDIEIRSLEQGTYFKETEEGKQDLCIDGWSNQTGDADFSLTPVFGSGGIKTGQNIARYNNPKIDQLLDQARSEIDPEKRKQLYYQVQEIVREDIPVIVTQVGEDLSVTAKNITGFWVTPGGNPMFNDVKFN